MPSANHKDTKMRNDQEICPDCNSNVKTKKAARCKPCGVIHRQKIWAEKKAAKEAEDKALKGRLDKAEIEISEKPQDTISEEQTQSVNEREAQLLQQIEAQKRMIEEMTNPSSDTVEVEITQDILGKAELPEIEIQIGDTTPDGKYYL